MRQDKRTQRPEGDGFTLIEVLVVLFILLLLAAIALPTARTLVSDQMLTRTARGLKSYIDAARNRAITEGREVGILLERTGADEFGRASSLRIRQMTGVPPYSGDASDSVAYLQTDGITAHFDVTNNQLMALSASLVADPAMTGDIDDPRAPIRNGDYIEFPGGRLAPFVITHRSLTSPLTTPVVITFDLKETHKGTESFPSSFRSITTPRPVKFKIHRRPTVSSTAPFNLPRGLALDLNYSGFGTSGNEFAPDVDPSIAANDIAIVFGTDGKIARVTDALSGIAFPPPGIVFLCVGRIEGVRPDDLLAAESRAPANLLSQDSLWMVINPGTGRVASAPNASVSTVPASTTITPTSATLATAIAEARSLANLSDTIDRD